jgi:hypothetical protein
MLYVNNMQICVHSSIFKPYKYRHWENSRRNSWFYLYFLEILCLLFSVLLWAKILYFCQIPSGSTPVNSLPDFGDSLRPPRVLPKSPWSPLPHDQPCLALVSSSLCFHSPLTHPCLQENGREGVHPMKVTHHARGAEAARHTAHTHAL